MMRFIRNWLIKWQNSKHNNLNGDSRIINIEEEMFGVIDFGITLAGSVAIKVICVTGVLNYFMIDFIFN